MSNGLPPLEAIAPARNGYHFDITPKSAPINAFRYMYDLLRESWAGMTVEAQKIAGQQGPWLGTLAVKCVGPSYESREPLILSYYARLGTDYAERERCKAVIAGIELAIRQSQGGT